MGYILRLPWDNLIHQTAFFNLTWGNVRHDSGGMRVPLPGNRQGIRAAAACPDCIWHAVL